MRRSIAALILALAIAPSHKAAAAEPIVLPPMPATIEAPAGHEPFLMTHAIGTQNYLCAPSASGVAWSFIGPQATVFDEGFEQEGTHYLSPNPIEGGIARATWVDSRDTSAVWARAIVVSTDPGFVAPGAVPWLLLEAVGTQDGPTGDALTETTYIQRLSTVGGVAPSTGCTSLLDINKRAFVPYEATYVFYKPSRF